jgi:hypothetical protein
LNQKGTAAFGTAARPKVNWVETVSSMTGGFYSMSVPVFEQADNFDDNEYKHQQKLDIRTCQTITGDISTPQFRRQARRRMEAYWAVWRLTTTQHGGERASEKSHVIV